MTIPKFLIFAPPHFQAAIEWGDLPPAKDVRATLPYGALSLASYATTLGIEAKVVPLRAFALHYENAVRLDDGRPETRTRFAYQLKGFVQYCLDHFDPDVVGLTLMMALDEGVTKLLIRIIRKLRPGVPIVLGGNHATFSSDRLLSEEDAPDFIALGEGETPLRFLATSSFSPTARTPGLAFRDPAGKIVSGGIAPLLPAEDLDYPLLHDLLWLPPGATYSDVDANVMFGRGCPFDCAFCVSPSMWRKKVRFKPVEVFANEVRGMINRGARHFSIWDDVINASPRRFRELCGVLETTEGASYAGVTRLDYVSPEDIDLARKAHITCLDFGLDSTDPGVLDSMNRTVDPALLESACGIVADRGIYVRINLIVGYPGSTLAADVGTIGRVRECWERGIVNEVYGMIFSPFPGTQASVDPRVRIVDTQISSWGCKSIVCEITNGNGKVVYSRGQILEAWKEFKRLEEDIRRRNPQSYSAAPFSTIPSPS